MHTVIIAWVLSVVFMICSSAAGQYKDDTCSKEEEGSLRLRGTNYTHAGRVEICHDRIWGVVCGNNWEETEAKVVCRQLGYTATAKTYIVLSPLTLNDLADNRMYNQPDKTAKRWLDNVVCTGNEHALVDCQVLKQPGTKQSNFLGRTTCETAFQKSAGVICLGYRSSADDNGSTKPSETPIRPGTGDQQTTLSTLSGMRPKVVRVATAKPLPITSTRTPFPWVTATTKLKGLGDLKYQPGLPTSQENRSFPGTPSITGSSDNSSTYLIPFVVVTLAVSASACILQACCAWKLRKRNKQLEFQLGLAEEKTREILFKERGRPTGSSSTNIAEPEQTAAAAETAASQIAHEADAKAEATKSFVNRKTPPCETARSHKVHTASTVRTTSAMETEMDGLYSKPTRVTNTLAIVNKQCDEPDYAIAGGPLVLPKTNDSEAKTDSKSCDIYSVPANRTGHIYSLPANRSDLAIVHESDTKEEYDDDEEKEESVLPPKAYEEAEI